MFALTSTGTRVPSFCFKDHSDLITRPGFRSSILVAFSRAASSGVLFRNAEAIEVLGSADTLVVDKTGTLTQGKPQLASVSWMDGFAEADVLRLAASVERASEHPIATAVVAGAGTRGIALSPVEHFASTTGKGVTGVVD